MRRCGSSARPRETPISTRSCERSSRATSASSRSRKVHRYYDSLCEPCGDFNYAKREQTADLAGHYALVTGARVKIGYQAALKLLRAGAHVVVTTRFPVDAASRYAKEPDFAEFRARLQIFGLDLRHTPSVDLFTRFLSERLPRLDYILNNACQTVRRPAGFFRHLLEAEAAPLASLPAAVARRARGSRRAVPRLELAASDRGDARARRRGDRGRARASCTARCFRSAAISTRTIGRATRCSPRSATTRICSRSTFARSTAGGCGCTRSRRPSCSRCSS